ncbi:MAG: ParA family protein [Desulfobacterales bacterium]|nr:ParA family protein [Desulfobacterales bacterium]
MAIKISLINMKGGVGKSTLTVNLAWHFAGRSEWLKNVLVVDIDPQFNASQYLIGVDSYKQILTDNLPTTWNIFEQHTQIPGTVFQQNISPNQVIYNAVRFRGGSRIDLLPSRLELALSQLNPGQKEQTLRDFISEVEDDYDLVIVDCPPTESLFTRAAYLSSNYILIPVKPEYLSSIGLPLVARSIQLFKNFYKQHELQVLGIVFNTASDYYPEEALSKGEAKAEAIRLNWYIFENEIVYSRSYPKGAREGEPIFRTSYARSDTAENFKKFANELAGRIGI